LSFFVDSRGGNYLSELVESILSMAKSVVRIRLERYFSKQATPFILKRLFLAIEFSCSYPEYVNHCFY